MYLMRCSRDKQHGYTLQKSCPTCHEPTVTAHPARFSPDDRFSRERITAKKRLGLLLTQRPPETL